MKQNINKKILRNKKYPALVILIITMSIPQTSCKKFLEIPPPNDAISESSVYSTDITAISVLTGIYAGMNNTSGPITGRYSINLLAGLSSDELILDNGITGTFYINYYHNRLSAITPPIGGSEHWNPLFNNVFKCNAAIEGLEASTMLTPAVKKQLLGEAKFMRAFFYFYLVNLFGDVPLALTSDPKINTLLARSPKADVYQQIIADLKNAEGLLSADYLNETLLKTTTERVRPTKWAAKALLARVFLYTGLYLEAEVAASSVINNTALYNLPILNNSFLKNSPEAIWQLQPTSPNFNTTEARIFIIPATGPNNSGIDAPNPVYLSDYLLNSFEPGDQRGAYGNWIDTTIYSVTATLYDTVTYPYKYKVNSSPGVSSPTNMSEYLMILRLGEQFLIRAEARAHLGNISGSQNDLNAIRSRAGLPPSTAGDRNLLLTAILRERQVELFTEWGHRWLDLKRTEKVDAVMSVVTPQKATGLPWQSYQQLYPIPQEDLKTAPNLRQNPGY